MNSEHSDRIKSLIDKILDTDLSEDYEWTENDAVVHDLAVYLDHFSELENYRKLQTEIRKRISLDGVIINTKSVLSSLDDLLHLPELGPTLNAIFSEIQSEEPKARTIPAQLRHAYDFYSLDGSIENLEYPKLHILELQRSLDCAIKALECIANRNYGNKPGAREKEMVPLILHLKVTLDHYCGKSSQTHVAGSIYELISLVGMRINKKTIRNILSSH
ncbi:hypothetical protein [Acidihalobacter prosperus]|uniref:hypothetical protein n=1 Tax=Acidihalobacter prosperus TaxID=160660 RepID=UPI0011AB4905|nr:hypothetical protein [Acidihalobacter prosperus]